MQMKLSSALLALPLVFAACIASAQAPVPIGSEPHHHPTFSSARLRVFRVEVPANSSTLLHSHDVDYFWIGIGAAEFTNIIQGKADAKVVSTDGTVHFTRGGFAHVARIDGAPFRNVTLELPQQQTHPRNLCATVIPDSKPACPVAHERAAAEFPGAEAEPEFTTDQTYVTLLTIAPGANFKIVRMPNPPILVTVDSVDATVQMTCPSRTGVQVSAIRARSGDTYPDAGPRQCSLHNSGKTPTRFLAIEFTSAAH